MDAYCPTSLYKHQYIVELKNSLEGLVAQAKLNGECSAGRVMSHFTVGASVMNPGEFRLPK